MSYTLVFFLFIALYLLVVWKAGKTYPILYLFIFTYFLQYIFATFLTYNEYRVLSIQMALKQGPYFEYTVPALCFLFSGVLLFNRDFNIREMVRTISPREANKYGYLLVFVSYFFDLIELVGWASITSVTSFTGFLKYLGAFCFLFSDRKLNYILVALIFGQLAVSVLQTGVFMSFFIWATYLFFFISLKFRLSFLLRVSFIVIAMPVLVIIQGVKNEYREATWDEGREGGLDLLTQLAQNNVARNDNESFSSSNGVISTVGRLSQGWHLGMTLKHVPKKEPFADGGEMFSDILSSILPRLIFPEKKVVHSQEKFYQYTGHKLYGGTSMTIGILGDFYVNFGWWGSMIGLFVFGVVLAKLLQFFIRSYVVQDPINVIWIPFMFSYLVRADNDFYTFFNCLIKGFLIFLVVHYIRRKLWLTPSPQIKP